MKILEILPSTRVNTLSEGPMLDKAGRAIGKGFGKLAKGIGTGLGSITGGVVSGVTGFGPAFKSGYQAGRSNVASSASVPSNQTTQQVPAQKSQQQQQQVPAQKSQQQQQQQVPAQKSQQQQQQVPAQKSQQQQQQQKVPAQQDRFYSIKRRISALDDKGKQEIISFLQSKINAPGTQARPTQQSQVTQQTAQKQLSQTPNAIRKRQRRAALKGKSS